jgi:hypothetical protein
MPVRRIAAGSIPRARLRVALAAALLLAGCGGHGGNKAGGAADLAFAQIGPDVFAVVIAPDADVPKTEAALRKHCADRPGCTVYGWASAASAARSFPLDDRHYATLAVRYVAHAVGTDGMMWDCLRFRAAKAPCLPKA